MSAYHECIVDIKNCATEKELLKVIQFIDANKDKLKLDSYQMEKLEAVGLKRYEEITFERNQMIKNRKK